MTELYYKPSPDETLQSVLEIFDTIIGVILFAGIVGSIADLVANANKMKTRLQQRMDGLKQFMSYRNLHTEFQRRVVEYFEYEMSKRENMTETEIRGYLPPNLYVQVNKYVQWIILTKSPLFKNCEVPFLKDVVAYLELRDFGPNEVLCFRGELNREMFVIADGHVKIVDHNNTILRTFHEGDVIEDRSLIWFENNRYQNRKNYNVISVGYSQVYILLRDDLLRVLSDYPQCRATVVSQAELLQREADELSDDEATVEMSGFDGSTLEERLLAVRNVLAALENTVNVNFKKFRGIRFLQKTSTGFKYRLTALERFCLDSNSSP
ncbi:cyclic nucleotide-binding domain protein [Dictyocaulus viviparus]|uniref:Cyclic nucleotide-binding domain protein n=1 Tax=Dictyocaulus viviparus TaxID=29172 RepID=A0A0D8Y9Z3_DICVI|nr:cyclic nucleotide-binding domain protein [Dictyocaulus viviparus]